MKKSAIPALGMILRALRYRNYRLFFGGQSISLIGTWMQQIAMSWLVYRLTKSALLLGTVAFAGQIPSFILSPFAGVLVDRCNRHRILIVTQILSMLQAFVLTFLIMTNIVTVWHIMALSVFLGLVNAIDAPTRQAFLFEMIKKKEDLGNAIALNSLMFNGARLVGPFIAGVLIALVGEGPCFLINGLSYIAVIAALFSMDVLHKQNNPNHTHALEHFKEGFKYVFGFPPIRGILLLVALVSLMGIPYVILMPIFATSVFGGGPETLGLLMSAIGIGALVGAVYLASQKTVLGFGNKIVLASSLFGIGLILFSLSRTMWISLILLSVAGFGMMVHMASSNTVLQIIIDDDKRGRVMSFYTMAFLGMAPFGSLFAGSLAGTIGAPNTLMIGGVCCILGSMLFANRLPHFKEMVKPVYNNM